MNDVVIDTNIVIWYFGNPTLPSTLAQSAIAAAHSSGTILVSSISIVELVYLVEKNRIPVDVLAALRDALDDPSSAFGLIELNREISDSLAVIPRAVVPDMPDRVIAATALNLGLPLITADASIRFTADCP